MRLGKIEVREQRRVKVINMMEVDKCEDLSAPLERFPSAEKV